MIHVFKRAWEDMLLPLWQRPKMVQVAALCYKDTPEGKKILLITSRDTGRWIVPKGWPINGKSGAQSALQEAWEEAGVSQADIEAEPTGFYAYDKDINDGLSLPVVTQVYLTKVRNIEDDYPEAEERTRSWFTPAEAADLVAEPELAEILLTL